MSLYDELPNEIKFTNGKGQKFDLFKKAVVKPPLNPNYLAKKSAQSKALANTSKPLEGIKNIYPTQKV